VLVAYVSGHGFGHLTRLGALLAAVRAEAPSLPITLVGAVPAPLVRRAIPGGVQHRATACDVGLRQHDALTIDEPGSAEACRTFEATWEARVEAEVEFLRRSGARAVLGDIPPLPFEAAGRAGVPSLALGNFSWDWIYRHLAPRQPGLGASADRAARAYRHAGLLLELPFAGDLSAFARRERIGMVARRPRLDRAEARRRLGLDPRPAVLVTFGGVAHPGLGARQLGADRELRWLGPEELPEERLAALGLDYPDVVGAVDVVLTKPGYGIVTDAIGAGTRLVYTERGDFPEYPVMVAELPRYLAAVHLSNAALLAGGAAEAVRRVLALPMPSPPALDGAARGAQRVLEVLGRSAR
jgi:L-arabinokinase